MVLHTTAATTLCCHNLCHYGLFSSVPVRCACTNCNGASQYRISGLVLPVLPALPGLQPHHKAGTDRPAIIFYCTTCRNSGLFDRSFCRQYTILRSDTTQNIRGQSATACREIYRHPLGWLFNQPIIKYIFCKYYWRKFATCFGELGTLCISY